MRIIAGEFRGRRIKSVPGLDVRPTPDRLREALFNVLAPTIAGTVFVDAYAGSGSVGIEALSRGARSVILIERDSRALAVIRENLDLLGITGRVSVVRGRAGLLLTRYPADILFLDPPYGQLDEYRLSLGAARCSLAIAQHPARVVLENAYGEFVNTRTLRQGSNQLTFFRPRENSLNGE